MIRVHNILILSLLAVACARGGESGSADNTSTYAEPSRSSSDDAVAPAQDVKDKPLAYDRLEYHYSDIFSLQSCFTPKVQAQCGAETFTSSAEQLVVPIPEGIVELSSNLDDGSKALAVRVKAGVTFEASDKNAVIIVEKGAKLIGGAHAIIYLMNGATYEAANPNTITQPDALVSTNNIFYYEPESVLTTKGKRAQLKPYKSIKLTYGCMNSLVLDLMSPIVISQDRDIGRASCYEINAGITVGVNGGQNIVLADQKSKLEVGGGQNMIFARKDTNIQDLGVGGTVLHYEDGMTISGFSNALLFKYQSIRYEP